MIQTLYASAGALVFSVYIVHDTQVGKETVSELCQEGGQQAASFIDIHTPVCVAAADGRKEGPNLPG